ncbi:Putative S-adenosyl-L-methionine-dependent methyltransferase [Septoria linicola]|uniref:S-adenosyl-L-methionine-dependent methyltransferase n=1 Tax=Septoria linicola TaxID=215465 RepID=A0A9Q9B1B6_9PEZI|nr:putative S-adenosyl-L-methionine-dependent methyltransferase [Septoria linicola]USW55753.1 Putative S-adenosyl-L-methionine-dependent methyltransferase [Septoria linicola]
MPNNAPVQPAQLVNGLPAEDFLQKTKDNLHAWDTIADHWEKSQSPEVNGKNDDGNDMFTQCLLPVVRELANWQAGETVLDLGAGSGIIARLFAKLGAQVTGLDFSRAMLDIAQKRSVDEGLTDKIVYDFIDLMSTDVMAEYMDKRIQEWGADRAKFDIITISTTLKSLPSLEPIAAALPTMLKPGGRIVNIDLHPAFSKPAGHRGMEIYEDPQTGKQQLSTYIKVPKYLNIPPSMSEAVRGQPEPLWIFHRPFWSLLDPFFRNGLVLDAMREPAFEGEPVLAQAQSYHNFQQTPMLLAFRLRHAPKSAT